MHSYPIWNEVSACNYRSIMRIDALNHARGQDNRRDKLRAKLIEYLIRLDREAGLAWVTQS